MKCLLILCQSAFDHPDGTFSLISGGIRRFHCPADRIEISATIYFRVESEPEDAGKHEFFISLKHSEKKNITDDEFKGTFTLKKTGHIAVSAQFAKRLAGIGNYEFIAKVDGKKVAGWKFEVLKKKEGT